MDESLSIENESGREEVSGALETNETSYYTAGDGAENTDVSTIDAYAENGNGVNGKEQIRHEYDNRIEENLPDSSSIMEEEENISQHIMQKEHPREGEPNIAEEDDSKEGKAALVEAYETQGTELVASKIQGEEKESPHEVIEIQEMQNVVIGDSQTIEHRSDEQSDEFKDDTAEIKVTSEVDDVEEAEVERKLSKGEIASDHGVETDEKETDAEKDDRKRRRDSEVEEELDEPKTKKAALEKLRNMRFAAKDPFKDNPPRDTKFSLLSSRPVRDRTPPPSSQHKREREEETRRRGRDETSASRRRRSRSPRRSNKAEESAASVIESRHQRSTMYLLQAEQKAKVQQARNVPVNIRPLRERIEALLSKPDHEVLAMPAADIRTLIMQGAELLREQEYFMTGRKAQIIEIDAMIAQEREAIERISKELPPQFRPPMFVDAPPRPIDQHTEYQNAQMAQQQPPRFMQFPPPQKHLEFSMFPPGMPPQQFGHPPPHMPLTRPPGMSQFGQTPSLLYTKPPPTSSASSGPPSDSLLPSQQPQQQTTPRIPMGAINSSAPPPQNLFANAEPPKAQQQIRQAPLSSIMSLSQPNFSVPPPAIAPKTQSDQQQMSQLPPPQIVISNTLKMLHTGTAATVTTGNSSVAKASFAISGPSAIAAESANKPPSLMPNLGTQKDHSVGFAQPPPQIQQLTAANPPHPTPTHLSPGNPASPKRTGAVPPSQPAPRPLMSINLGLPHQPQMAPHQQIRQPPSGTTQQPAFGRQIEAEQTQAGRGRGRRLKPVQQRVSAKMGSPAGGAIARGNRRGGGIAKSTFKQSRWSAANLADKQNAAGSASASSPAVDTTKNVTQEEDSSVANAYEGESASATFGEKQYGGSIEQYQSTSVPVVVQAQADTTTTTVTETTPLAIDEEALPISP